MINNHRVNSTYEAPPPMAALGGGWVSTKVRDGHAADRSVEDALQELYMNALDGAEVVGEPDRHSIEPVGAGIIEISNACTVDFDESDLFIGGRHGDQGDPKKMGRHSLGLKDALAVLLREKWQVVLNARGHTVEFAFQPEGPQKDNVIHYRSTKATEAAGDVWKFCLTPPDSIPDVAALAASIKTYFDPPGGEPILVDSELKVAIYAPNVLSKGKKQPAFKHGGNAGIFIGKRFVRFASDSNVSHFGYHIREVSLELKKLISRDHIIKGVVAKSGPLAELLREVIIKNRQQLLDSGHYPETLCRELKILLPEEAPAVAAGARSPAGGFAGTVVRTAEPAPEPARQPAALTWESAAADGWSKEQTANAKDQQAFAFLDRLNQIAGKVFPECYPQVVPYGSMIYQVETRTSDIDATLIFALKPADAGSTSADEYPKQTLTRLMEVLKVERMNVIPQFEGKHPILMVQKDQRNGVPCAVDISFDGHLAIHKSHEVAKLLDGRPGARSLAVLVKQWVAAVGLKRTSGQHPCLSSHAWMLLVIEYMSAGATRTADRSELGFFKWIIASYDDRTPWIIGAGRHPFEFERENVAQAVGTTARADIKEKVEEAIAMLNQGKEPWSGSA